MALGRAGGGWAVGLAIMTAGSLAAQAVPGQLGMNERDAQESFLGSVIGGYPRWSTAAAAAFVALPASARVAVVQGGFAWAGAWVKSAAFRTGYETERQNAKPRPPEHEGTVDDELKRHLAERRKDLEESRKALAALPPEQRKELEAVFKLTEDQLKDPEYLGMMRTGIEMERAGELENYQSSLTRWEEAYPADARVLVARRLQAFLTECGDVDFSARLQARDRKMVFVNPDYELKSTNWKTCFRAGREAVGAARTAATAWLKELPGT
jgi:hypothetical protein